MAKFIYRMQNILNIKYKLEESAKQEYAEARQALVAEEQKLDALKKRKQGYYEAYQASIQGRLDFLEIEENANSMDILDMMIEEQNAVIRQKSKELELARQKMAREMQERKMHEKLKEKKFDEFKQELNATEKRETDEVAGYQFTSAKKEVEDNGKNKREKGENSGSNKGVGILIGVLIVITWLSVMCLLIKCDVGGFGSRVLRPVFKDVPMINKILPDASDEEVAIESDYPYTNLEDALKHIADQDAAIGSKDAEISELNDKVTELQAEVDRLTTIAKDQSDFEDEKKKFYDEIVYGDSAPDTDTYKEWYNELDAESAAEIYQQVLEQDQADDSIKKMAQSYEEMNASEAAKILETMGNDLDTVALIMNNMDAQSRGKVLAAMDPDFAAAVTKKLLP